MRHSAHRFAPYLNTNDGTLFRPDPRGGAYEYEVVLRPRPDGTPDRRVAARPVHNEFLLAMPEPLKATAAQDRRARGRDRSTTTAATGIAADARALESLPPRFRPVQLHPADGCRSTADLDPVEDFLVNRKKGHCEYFASALALLLRSIDIPSRMVNGFKGGDWNELTETMNVRQKHAHSWVEAYIGRGPENAARSGSPSIRPRPRSATSRSPRSAGSPATSARSPT